MKIKKIVFCILVMGLMFVLTACGNQNKSFNLKNDVSGETVQKYLP